MSIDDLLKQAFAKGRELRDGEAERFPAWKALVEHDDRAAVVRALVARIRVLMKRPLYSSTTAWSAFDRDPDFHRQALLEALLERCIQGKVAGLGEEDVLAL